MSSPMSKSPARSDERLKASDSAKQDSAESPEVSKSSSLTPLKPKSSNETGQKVTGIVSLGKELFQRFNADECLTRSQALSFISVLSLGPLLLFALAVLGFVIHDPLMVQEYVKHLVEQALPGKQAAEAANQIIAQTRITESAQTLVQGKWWATLIGAASLLWAAISLFAAASQPMNIAWEVKETRNFLQLRLVCLGVFLGSGILFLFSLAPSSGPSFVRSLHIPWLGMPKPIPWGIDLLFWLLAILVNSGMFTLIYRFLPNAKISWREAFYGGIVAGFLWEIFKKAFAVYLAHFANFNKLYGALGGVILLITWIWYSCIVLLLGAIICKMSHEHHHEGGVAKQSNPESDSK